MAENEQKNTPPAKEEKKQAKVSRSVANIFTGNFLTRKNVLNQLPFVFFLTAIGIAYIANGYYAEKTVIELNKVNNDIKELRSEYITLKSELNFRSKQSQVAKAVQPLGLKESVIPPIKITVSKSEKELADKK